jgi:hypothetical protein
VYAHCVLAVSLFEDGFPHFWEKSKQDKLHKHRLKIHTVISHVDGSITRVFIAQEHLASDPNFNIEVLYRSLYAEEALRGFLPPILYVQLDNCPRENKNTYVFAYLAWLLERGIFREVYVSFLPVGHTHCYPDQFGSRIAIALKYKDCVTLAEFMYIIRQCSTPMPAVEVIDSVPDVKALFNPSGKQECPVSVSRVRAFSGCATKEEPVGDRKFFMTATSPLHFYIRKDVLGKVFIQTKLIAEDDKWAEQHYPWTDEAPRPENRAFTAGTCGLRPSDLKMCPQKFLEQTRIAELEKSMPHIKTRLSAEEWEPTFNLWQNLLRDRELENLPVPNGGLFHHEADEPVEGALVAVGEEQQPIYLRPNSRIFSNAYVAGKDRELRKVQGRSQRALEVDNYIAVTAKYGNHVPQDTQEEFWVGKILALNSHEKLVHVQYWKVRNLDAQLRIYVLGQKSGWVPVKRALCVFKKLGKNGTIPAVELRKIRNVLLTPDSDSDSDSDNEAGVVQGVRRGAPIREYEDDWVIGKCVALTGHYKADVPSDQRHDFWVGKIVGIDREETALHVHYYNTGSLRNVTASNAKYRVDVSGNKLDWVCFTRVLHAFNLPSTRKISAEDRLKIKTALAGRENEADVVEDDEERENEDENAEEWQNEGDEWSEDDEEFGDD